MLVAAWLCAGALVAGSLGLVACGETEQGPVPEARPQGETCDCAVGAAVVDPALLAFLSKAKAAHHRADLAGDGGIDLHPRRQEVPVRTPAAGDAPQSAPSCRWPNGGRQPMRATGERRSPGRTDDPAWRPAASNSRPVRRIEDGPRRTCDVNTTCENDTHSYAIQWICAVEPLRYYASRGSPSSPRDFSW